MGYNFTARIFIFSAQKRRIRPGGKTGKIRLNMARLFLKYMKESEFGFGRR